MRYRTFRALVIGGVLAASGGAIGACIACSSSGDAPAASASTAVAKRPSKPPSGDAPATGTGAAASPAATSAANGPPLAEGEEALRPMDQEILDLAAKSISGDKVKDAIKGRAWKVNLYKDAGHAKVNRLKIDLNRNDKWEEKWTFEDDDTGKVKREVAPNDDENYTLSYRLLAGKWVKK